MGFESASGGGGASAFTELSDAPGSYAGQALLTVRVKSTEDGVEFYDAAGAGDVVGPSSATDYAFALFDGATGKLLRNSAIVSNATNDVSGMTTLTLPNTGLHILDSNATHDLIIKPGSNLTADRTLTLTTGDADRTISVAADLTFGGTVNIAKGFSTAGGSFDLDLTLSANTALTLPTSGTVAVLTNRLDQFAAPTASVSMNSQLITNLLDPSGAQDAASKAYVDAVASGLSLRNSCRVATTADLNATYNGGALTLTCNVNGAIVVDTISLSSNNRVLVKNQTTATQNGLYSVTTVGTAGTPFVLTRTTDADSSAEIVSGLYVFVTAGAVGAAKGFVLTTADPITMDTTALTFTQFSSAGAFTAGNGLTLVSTAFSVVADTGISVSASGVAVDFTAVQGKDATLDALAAFNSNGMIVQTAADTFASRTITAGDGIAVTNGNGVSGNPTIAMDVNSITTESIPDPNNDLIVIYDVSAGAHRKTLMRNAGGSGNLYKQVGTSPLECWYSEMVSSSTATTVATVVNYLYAFPFYYENPRTIDRLAFYVSTAGVAGSVGRVGIYEATSPDNLYPDSLIIDGGEMACDSTGAKTATVSQALEPKKLYWFVFTFGVGTPTLRACTIYSVADFLGFANTLATAHNTGIRVATAYAALPATFPSGAALITTNPMLGYVRFSA